VHALLAHLEDAGFDGSPRVLGFDDDGREVLSWVEGSTPVTPWPDWMLTDQALSELGSLLRAYHEAVAGFVPPPGSPWRAWLGAPGGPIIRHGDLWPSNVVFREARPVALIDWEFAQPGEALDDVASAAKHWVPLTSDDRAREEGWPGPLDRTRRLRLLADSYGLNGKDRAALIPRVLRNSLYGYESHRVWGEAGVPGFAEMWKAGSGAAILADREWLDEHQEPLHAGLGETPE
jgi:hypothetical protein